jgi:hypothetical protein
MESCDQIAYVQVLSDLVFGFWCLSSTCSSEWNTDVQFSLYHTSSAIFHSLLRKDGYQLADLGLLEATDSTTVNIPIMQDRGGQVAGVAITFFMLTWLAVGLRCYVRFVLSKVPLFRIQTNMFY